MSMSVETWVIVIVLLLAVAGATYYIIDKNKKDEFKNRKKHEKLVAERMKIANKRKQQADMKKEVKSTMNISSKNLKPPFTPQMRMTQQQRAAENFRRQQIAAENFRRKQIAAENFRRKEKMMHSPHESTPLKDLNSYNPELEAETQSMFQPTVFTNEHIAPTFGGLKKFAGHGDDAGDHIRGHIEVKGKGVFSGQTPVNSSLPHKKGFMHL